MDEVKEKDKRDFEGSFTQKTLMFFLTTLLSFFKNMFMAIRYAISGAFSKKDYALSLKYTFLLCKDLVILSIPILLVAVIMEYVLVLF